MRFILAAAAVAGFALIAPAIATPPLLEKRTTVTTAPTATQFSCSTPAAPRFVCGEKGTVSNPQGQQATTDFTFETCRDSCFSAAQCVSFSFGRLSGSSGQRCTLYTAHPRGPKGMGFKQSSKGVKFWNKHCFKCQAVTTPPPSSTPTTTTTTTTPPPSSTSLAIPTCTSGQFLLKGANSGDPNVDNNFAVIVGDYVPITAFTSDPLAASVFFLDESGYLSSFEDQACTIVQHAAHWNGDTNPYTTFWFEQPQYSAFYGDGVATCQNNGPTQSITCSTDYGSTLLYCTTSDGSQNFVALANGASDPNLANNGVTCDPLALVPVPLPLAVPLSL